MTAKTDIVSLKWVIGLIIKQAGGSVTDVEGRPLLLDPEGFSALVSNAHLAEQLAHKP